MNQKSKNPKPKNGFNALIPFDFNKKGGFTLLEFVMYIGIVGIVVTIAGSIGLNVLFGKAKLTAIEEVSQNARFAMEKIGERVRNAQAINSPAPGGTSSTLSLAISDAAKNPTVFDLSGGSVRIQEGVASPVILSSSEITVTNLQFINISYPATPGTVRIQMAAQFTNPSLRQEYSFGKTFYTTANIRKK